MAKLAVVIVIMRIFLSLLILVSDSATRDFEYGASLPITSDAEVEKPFIDFQNEPHKPLGRAFMKTIFSNNTKLLPLTHEHVLRISGTTHPKARGVKSKKSTRSMVDSDILQFMTQKSIKKPPPPIPSSTKIQSELNHMYEIELAKDIEANEVKFVESERNPLQYIVEDGILFKKSKFRPIARLVVPVLGTKTWNHITNNNNQPSYHIPRIPFSPVCFFNDFYFF